MSARCNRCLQYYDPEQTHNCVYIKEFTSFKDFLLVYQCGRCDAHFTGMSNSGRHQCRYHPGIIGLDGKWTCCGGGRSYHTNPNVYNMVWTRMGQGPPPIIDLHPGCTPCDHFHPDNRVELPMDFSKTSCIHLLAHLEPKANERPGWDGKRLWPHPTYSTAAFEVEEEQKEQKEQEEEKELSAISSGDEDEGDDIPGRSTPPVINVSDTEDEEDNPFA